MLETLVANASQYIETNPWLAIVGVFAGGALTASSPCVSPYASSIRSVTCTDFRKSIFSATTIVPSFTDNVPGWWKKYLAPEGLRLGLDLQGGMHLVLSVNLDKAVENSLDFAAQDLRDALLEKQISVVKTKSAEKEKVVFTLPNTSALDTVRSMTEDEFPNLNIELKAEEGSFPRIIMRLTDERIEFIKKNAVSQSLEIIRNRIDQFGVAEPIILRQGKNEIF